MTNPRMIRECPGCGSKYETYTKKNGSPHREYCCKDCSNRSRVANASDAMWEQRRSTGDMRSPRMRSKVSLEEYLRRKNDFPLCACGCGNRVETAGKRYIFMHFANTVRGERVTKKCARCGTEFTCAAKWAHLRSCCSHSCQMILRETGKIKAKRIDRSCPICGKSYKITPSDAAYGKRATCSKSCGIEASRRAKIKDPSGRLSARPAQRVATLASRQTCDHCGYGEIVDLLVIHHIDHNPLNGDPANILLLCPMCHAKEHYRLKTGWFTKVKHGSPKTDRHITRTNLPDLTLM